eukprot:3030951-Prymnesium_polylepis.1
MKDSTSKAEKGTSCAHICHSTVANEKTSALWLSAPRRRGGGSAHRTPSHAAPALGEAWRRKAAARVAAPERACRDTRVARPRLSAHMAERARPQEPCTAASPSAPSAAAPVSPTRRRSSTASRGQNRRRRAAHRRGSRCCSA